ncbi:SMP-30/gluconolactonase/LRE family protein [Sphingomonas sp. H160509]|uniref:SMP-30/gluconolactonase/LRE family protein n=1 Tax=Sphingomonas sp. H160509 TaxID=2955313 RepID=UPI00406C9ADC
MKQIGLERRAKGTFRPGRRDILFGAMAMVAAPAFGAGPAAEPRIQRISPAFDRMVAPGTRVETIATGIRWAEGPVWVEAGQYLLFSDPPANIVRRWRKGGPAMPFLDPSGAAGTDPKFIREPGANGLTLDHAGRLLIANSGGRSIDRVDLVTRRREVAIDRYQGKRFNSPNDMHVARDGTIYFTDPPYGLTEGDTSPLKEMSVNGVYRLRPGGVVELLEGSLTRPNGIALSPDETRLYVSVSDETAPPDHGLRPRCQGRAQCPGAARCQGDEGAGRGWIARRHEGRAGWNARVLGARRDDVHDARCRAARAGDDRRADRQLRVRGTGAGVVHDRERPRPAPAAPCGLAKRGLIRLRSTRVVCPSVTLARSWDAPR